ncbi:hypothetical protein [Vibrio nomapromontoriensis]|uniref:hypothetical protein n=1 Tax=Vibrio nomapromontoriensis TaxID=2910246 RepID=UPI003D105C46
MSNDSSNKDINQSHPLWLSALFTVVTFVLLYSVLPSYVGLGSLAGSALLSIVSEWAALISVLWLLPHIKGIFHLHRRQQKVSNLEKLSV